MNKEYIQACKNQDPRSQKAVFLHFAPKMMTICRRYVYSDENAKDVLQEAFLKLFKNIDLYDEQKSNFESWIRMIVVQEAITYWRKYIKKSNFVEEDLVPLQIENPIIEAQLDEENILELIKSLPDSTRIVFNLYVFEGMTHQEISQTLHIGESTSRSQLTRARKQIQEAILIQNRSENYAKIRI